MTTKNAHVLRKVDFKMRTGAINLATLKGRTGRGDEDERLTNTGFSRNSVEG